jgi:hypothetical protein
MFNLKIQFKRSTILAFFALLFIFSCKKDETTEEENITRIQIHLTGTNGSSFDKEFDWKDTNADNIADGIDTIRVPANTTFKAHVHVYDDTKTPIADLTEEIEAESNVHLFVFKPSTTGLSITDLNKDAAGLPFGITSTWKTTEAANGTFRLLLHHEPVDKNAAEPGGEVDFDVTFVVIVE